MTDSFVPVDQLDWERGVPDAITSDPIWKLHAYRPAFFLLDLARSDIRVGMKCGFDRDIAAQLLESATSVSANLSEGYSRATRADRLRLLGYALGSLRESVSWYRKATDFLPPGTSDDRLRVIARIRPLLGLMRSTRARAHPGTRWNNESAQRSSPHAALVPRPSSPHPAPVPPSSRARPIDPSKSSSQLLSPSASSSSRTPSSGSPIPSPRPPARTTRAPRCTAARFPSPSRRVRVP